MKLVEFIKVLLHFPVENILLSTKLGLFFRFLQSIKKHSAKIKITFIFVMTSERPRRTFFN